MHILLLVFIPGRMTLRRAEFILPLKTQSHMMVWFPHPVHCAEVDSFSKVEALVETAVVRSRKSDHKLPGTLVGSIDLVATRQVAFNHYYCHFIQFNVNILFYFITRSATSIYTDAIFTLWCYILLHCCVVFIPCWHFHIVYICPFNVVRLTY